MLPNICFFHLSLSILKYFQGTALKECRGILIRRVKYALLSNSLLIGTYSFISFIDLWISENIAIKNTCYNTQISNSELIFMLYPEKFRALQACLKVKFICDKITYRSLYCFLMTVLHNMHFWMQLTTMVIFTALPPGTCNDEGRILVDESDYQGG